MASDFHSKDDEMCQEFLLSLKFCRDANLSSGEYPHLLAVFVTGYPGVVMPEYLREKYPATMTFVLQYNYRDLRITESGFWVVMSFSGIEERLFVPLRSIMVFRDYVNNRGHGFSNHWYAVPNDFSVNSVNGGNNGDSVATSRNLDSQGVAGSIGPGDAPAGDPKDSGFADNVIFMDFRKGNKS